MVKRVRKQTVMGSALGARQRRVSAPLRGRRTVQLTLAAFWAVDALLQLQPVQLANPNQLVFGTILGNAENQPQPIYGSLVSASHLLGPYALELDLAIVAIQLAIAIGLVWPRSVRPALAVSIAWSLGVWWLGEGFGGIFAGKGTLLVGAPGPALLYALLALVVWPTARRSESTIAGRATIASEGALGERVTRGIWVLLWVGGALLRVVPFWFQPVYALAGDFQLSLDEEPHWILALGDSLSHFAASAGLTLVIAMAAVEAAIGVGVLTRHRWPFLTAGMVLATIYWVFGQQFAGLFSGSATDVGAGPLYVLLAMTLGPLRSAAPARQATRLLSSADRRAPA